MLNPNIQISKFRNSKLKVGLLGGSFNPAHEGHLHISKIIRKTLGLDQIWWLVSPQNPLKPTYIMAPFLERYLSAKKLAKSNYIIVTDIEKMLNSTYTIDIIEKLQTRFPRIKFVWILGADNLCQFSHWRSWRKILNIIPLVVFDRDPYSYKSLNSKAAQTFSRFRLNAGLSNLASTPPPAWCFLRLRKHPISSTKLRELALD